MKKSIRTTDGVKVYEGANLWFIFTDKGKRKVGIWLDFDIDHYEKSPVEIYADHDKAEEGCIALTEGQRILFGHWMDDNVVKTEHGYLEQTTQYRKCFGLVDLYEFYLNEYWEGERPMVDKQEAMSIIND